jgi:hypothetical protein
MAVRRGCSHVVEAGKDSAQTASPAVAAWVASSSRIDPSPLASYPNEGAAHSTTSGAVPKPESAGASGCVRWWYMESRRSAPDGGETWETLPNSTSRHQAWRWWRLAVGRGRSTSAGAPRAAKAPGRATDCRVCLGTLLHPGKILQNPADGQKHAATPGRLAVA